MRFKSIIGAFIFFVIASSFALIFFVQTDRFGLVASKVISDLGSRKAQAEISFKNISISLFPPGVELNQVKISKKIADNEDFKSEFGKLGFYVGLVELEEKKISLGRITISDSTVDYSYPEKEEELKKIDQKIIDEVFKRSNQLPIRIDTVTIENLKVFANYDVLEVKKLKLLKRREKFLARFHIANLRPVQEKNISIDEIWGDAEIGRKNISIQRLKVQHDVHSILLKGKIENYPALTGAKVGLTGESSLYLQNLRNNIPMPESLFIEKGYAHLNFSAGFENKQLKAFVDSSISGLDSNLIMAEQILMSIELRDNLISLNTFEFKNNQESLRLKSAQSLFNLKTRDFLKKPIEVEAKKLNLTNSLRFIPSLQVLKGELTGDILLTHENQSFEIKPRDGFIIDHFGLIVGESPGFPIMKIKKAKLDATTFRIVKDEFQMDSKITLAHSVLDVHGAINSKTVDFNVHDAQIDFEDFGNLAKLDIKGLSLLDINVSGPSDDTRINLKGKTKGFEILGYKLGLADKEISIGLRDSSVVINKLEAQYKSTPISGNGVINYDNLDIALGINSPKANFHDLTEILTPIFSKLSFLPEDLDLTAKIDADIFGKTSMELLRLKSDIQFKDLQVFGETLSSGGLSIGLNKQLLTLNDLTAYKGKGQLRGDFSYNLKSEQMKVDYEWDEIALSSFRITKKAKLNINGLLSGAVSGEGSSKDYLFKVETKLDETRSQEFNFEDSLFHVKLSPGMISGDVSLFGKVIESDFDLSLKANNSSRINFSLDAPNIKPLATAFLGQHLESEDFSGQVKFSFKSKYNGDFKDVNLEAKLSSFVLKHQNFNVNYSSAVSQFLVENGQIKRWNLFIEQPDIFLQTKGRGRFGQEITLNHDLHFNSKLFELILAPVLSSEGFIRNSFRVHALNNQYDFFAKSQTSDLNLTIDSVPFPLNHLSYDIECSDSRLIISSLKTSLENGSVGFKGDVFFDDNYPDINIKYNFDKAEIPILGKSHINLSGEGIILGNAPPYNVGGEIIINKAQIVNELNDFSSKSNAISQVRFLPQNQESTFGKLVNLNVNVKTDVPVRITNSLMDISLYGEVLVSGSPSRLRGEGSLRSPPNTSRVFFKNNEYFIMNADLNFSAKKDIANPDFDVQALTYISSYKVNTKAYGDLERFNFDLTSEPALSRNSILSLIAFGYSDEIQSTLTQEQQQNLTQVGVGSFVFDRFKISDILNKQFGLQVNLGTVFEQSPTDSLLSGRSQEGQGAIGRTRTATKIELKKRLDEALNLSVSSTMGGSIGQRQSMNLNYSLNKKVQLEGVYELRTNAEGEEDIIDNSIGGDLKFRWTFK